MPSGRPRLLKGLAHIRPPKAESLPFFFIKEFELLRKLL